jgi:N utilization substance protein A
LILNQEREEGAQETKTEHPKAAEAEPEDDQEIKFNPKTMVSLTEARNINPAISLDEELRIDLETPTDFGRMATQTAKQVIIQKIREAEREHIYTVFKDREHELVNGMIQRVEQRVILVDIDKTTALMPKSEQISHEQYRIGNRMKFYIKEVNQTPKGPEIVVSRNHPEIIRKLFVIEVPEISNGTVKIQAIAREAGSRSKIAVMSKEENIDPIGACVGQRGARVQTIINELGGEKIDIIEFSADPAEFIAHALSPAKVLTVDTTEEEKSAKAIVKEDQLSLAIGKGGQNVRLAARLTGWRIDVVEDTSGETKMSSEEEAATEKDETTEEVPVADTTPEDTHETPTVSEDESPETILSETPDTKEKIKEEDAS